MDTLPQEVLDLIEGVDHALETNWLSPALGEKLAAVKALLPKPPEPIVVKVTRVKDHIGDRSHNGYPDGWDRIYNINDSRSGVLEHEETWEAELRPIRKLS